MLRLIVYQNESNFTSFSFGYESGEAVVRIYYLLMVVSAILSAVVACIYYLLKRLASTIY